MVLYTIARHDTYTDIRYCFPPLDPGYRLRPIPRPRVKAGRQTGRHAGGRAGGRAGTGARDGRDPGKKNIPSNLHKTGRLPYLEIVLSCILRSIGHSHKLRQIFCVVTAADHSPRVRHRDSSR